jgi:hypothetical protein
MHRTNTGLRNYNASASEGSYGSIISQSVIFFTPKIYLGRVICRFLLKRSLIPAEATGQKLKMALVFRPRIVKHKVSLRFVAELPIFEDINKSFSWLRRSIN